MPVMYGPVAPTASAIAALRPLGLDDVELTEGGRLGDWQRLNAVATLPHCIDNIVSAGALSNLRRVAEGERGGHAGMWFADSDVYKTLEAASWAWGAGTRDGRLDGFIHDAVRMVRSAQEADGYLNSWIQLSDGRARWRDLRWSHELYCAGHLIQAGVAASRSGASQALAEAAVQLADLVSVTFGPDGRDGIDGHPEAETALVELYRLTGQERYLQTAQRMIDVRGHGLLNRNGGDFSPSGHNFGPRYFQDHEPVRRARFATGHAVRQLYLESGVVDVAVEIGDGELLAASQQLWEDLFSTKTYLTGGHGSRHRDEAIGDPYELPPDRAYAETCAAIASMQWNWRLLLATGRARYADEMERALYNAVSASTSVDGQHYFYSNPLHLRSGHDGSDADAPSHRLSWYACACCPPNLARLVASLNGYIATSDHDGVQIHLYASGTVHAPVPGGDVTLRVSTGYPWDGRIAVTVERVDTDAPWTLSLRVPQWCHRATVCVDGDAVESSAAATASGYLRLVRCWPAGTSVELEMEMPPRVVRAHARVDAVRGCVAVARGPLLYCFEQADLPAGVDLDDVVLLGSPVVTTESVLDVPVTLRARGGVRAERPMLYGEAESQPDATGLKSIDLTAIPYFRWANRQPGGMRVWMPHLNSALSGAGS